MLGQSEQLTNTKILSDSFRQVGFFAHRRNTLGSIQELSGRKLGIEIDVRVSVDGVPFLFHDSRKPSEKKCRRKKDQKMKIESFTIQQIQAIPLFEGRGENKRRSNQQIPTLAKVMETFPKMPLLIDLKSKSIKAESFLCKTLARSRNLSNILVIADDLEMAGRLAQDLPSLQVSWGVCREFNQTLNYLEQMSVKYWSVVKRLFQSISFPAGLIASDGNRRFVEFFKDNGLGVFGYGVKTRRNFCKCKRNGVIAVSDYFPNPC